MMLRIKNNRLILAVKIFAVVFFLISPAASGAINQPVAHQSLRAHPTWQAKSKRVAARYWGSDCDVTIVEVYDPDTSPTSWAGFGDCLDDGVGTIWARWTLLDPYPSFMTPHGKWVARCTTIVHEWGHLVGWLSPTGKVHSADYGNVMNSTIGRHNYLWKACGKTP